MPLDPADLRRIARPHLTGDLRSWPDVELAALGRRAEISLAADPATAAGG